MAELRSSVSNVTVNDITSSWTIRSDNVAVAIFCETITVHGRKELPVQVSIVDNYFKCRLHQYIKIPGNVLIENYRIFNHGLPLNLLRTKGHDFANVREKIISLVAGKLVVGYNLPSLLKVLTIDEYVPKDMLRDIKISRFFNDSPRTDSFEATIEKYLGLDYCKGLGLHCATTNADMAMRMFVKYQDLSMEEWRGGKETEEDSPK